MYKIAKNKWLDVLRSNNFKKTKTLNYESLMFFKNEEQNEDENLTNNKLKKVMAVFKHLGQPCKQLLSTFYFDKIY